MRRRIPKGVRERVWAKYGGRCAYCGHPVSLGEMQVDHIDSVYGEEVNPTGRDIDDIGNYNPSCRMCNFYKGASTVEGFRERLKVTLAANIRRPFDFRLGERIGLCRMTEWDGRFYFEKTDGTEG